MNKNVFFQLIGISLILLSLLVLAGCQPDIVSSAGAASESPALSSEVETHPADRKFYNSGYITNLATHRSSSLLANIDPADRKFFTAGYITNPAVSGKNDPAANIHPADRKFFHEGYISTNP